MGTYSAIDADAAHRAIFRGVDGTNDNDVVIETDDISQFDTFTFMSTAGGFDVYGSLDGTNFTNAPLSLTDMGATASAPVIAGVANRMYGLAGAFRKLRVLQNGGTALVNMRMFAKRTAV